MKKIPKSESKTVEFKTAFNQDAIVSLVAFANSDGGSVYVGVRDDGRVVGVQMAGDSETSWVNEIKRIVDACKTHRYVDAEFMDLWPWFRVVLRKTGDGNFVKPCEMPQKSSQKNLDLLAGSSTLTTQDIAERLGISRRAVAKHVYNLHSSGHLRRVGPDKGGHWEVLEVGK